MEILISVVAKIAECTVEPIGHQLGYVCFIHANFQKLKTQVEKLKDTKGSVQDKVFAARRNAEDIKPVVDKWLSEVDDIIGKCEAILANDGEIGRLCSINLLKRHKLSRKASKMANEALEMKIEGEKFDTVSYKVSVSLVESSLLKVPDFLNFDSRNSIMEQILDALSDDNVHRIGVYGMGGVGKTMLVKEVVRKAMEKKSFDEAITSTLSQTPDLKSIQGQLADKLGLKFEQETIEGRALRLQKRLKMEKSILVVLDDVWEYIDLETIGIPSVEDHKGCKILFTSRDRHLISNEMCVNKIFGIHVLGENESWNLFKAMTNEIDEAYDLKPIATQIVRECAGLPIVITTVAKALRNKSSSIWNDALDQLKRDDVIVNIKGINKKVYLSLKLSYDYLECEEAKLLFLLCSMFPEDFNIDVGDLQEYAMSMGFLHGVNTVAQGRRRITTLVEDLISSSLLIQSEFKKNYVKMHDIVRDIAISIASKNDRIRTLSYVKRSNEEWEIEKFSGDLTAVSLTMQEFHNLDLHKLMLPKVQLFTLHGESSLTNERVTVAETFLEDMKYLKGLVLENVKVSLLSSSFYSSTNLRLLRLNKFEIESGSLDVIGELKRLEILDLSGPEIVEIPTIMSQLTHLKVLNLCSCHRLKVIPPNILSKLTKLEELSMGSFKSWEREEWYEGKQNASLSELRYLPHLYALRVVIQDEKIMPKRMFSRELNLENFYITIGRTTELYSPKDRNHFRILDLKMESEEYLDDWLKVLLEKSEEVSLEGSIVPKVLDTIDFLHLKDLCVSSNLEFKRFIDDEKKKPFQKWLSMLEMLKLARLENLESVTHGEFPFKKLRNVTIRNCNKLETLFFKSMADDILNLEEIEITFCNKLEVMFKVLVAENEDATNHIEFTRLKSLFVWNSPLQKFCSKIMNNFGQLSQQNSSNDPQATSTISNDIIGGGSFFSDEVLLPNLEILKIHDVDSLKMIWMNNNNALIPNSFSKLKKVELYGCNNLRNVFASNMISILTSLNSLRIRECELLEGIFEVQGEATSETNTSPILLRNLIVLDIGYLPNLEYLWSKNPCDHQFLTFENITTLTIEECSKLKGQHFSSIKLLKELQTLKIDIRLLTEALGNEKSANMLQESIKFQNHKVEVVKELGDGFELFPKLKSLKLYGYSTHLPMEIVQIMLYQLEYFELEEAFIEEIIPSKIQIPLKKHYARSKFLQRRWDLSKLPKLRHLWSHECPQNNNASSILEDLTYLYITECGELHSLVSWSSSPSLVSFTNLKELHVHMCDRLTYLLNPLTATTLVQLEKLELSNCNMMSSVIEEGNDDEVIVFNNLQILTISSCSRLTSFSCGKCIIKFPRLNLLHIFVCPEMNVFSLGSVSTPHLKPEGLSLYSFDTRYLLKESQGRQNMVEDMNLIIREYWEYNHIETSISYLFTQQILEENQSEQHYSNSSPSVSDFGVLLKCVDPCEDLLL